VIIKTGRFGDLNISNEEILRIPLGILGFPDLIDYVLVDPADDTLILWLQSLQEPGIAFPVLEPKIFRPDYSVNLSGNDQRELGLLSLKDNATVLTILTIPALITEMTANLKAPLVINLNQRIAKQVVLQENEYQLRHPMFRELKTHLMTIQSQVRKTQPLKAAALATAVGISKLEPYTKLKGIQLEA